MKRVIALVALVGLAVLGSSSVASAGAPNGRHGGGGPTPLNEGHWQRFWWTGPDRQYARNGPFTFTSEGDVTLRVTDDFCRGDRFAVYDNGAFLGRTTPSVDTGSCDALAPRDAFKDPSFSHGVYHLGAGDHSIVIIVVQNPFQGGAAFLIYTA